jgi:hypothetical protein
VEPNASLTSRWYIPEQGWYRLDENAVEPLRDKAALDRGEYRLRPRTGRFEDAATWTLEVEQPLGAALRQAAGAEWLDPSDSRRLKFEGSATEQEIVAGALSVPDAHEHVCAFYRQIVLADGTLLVRTAPHDARQYRGFIDLLSDGQHADGAEALHALKRRLSAHLDLSGERHTYSAKWSNGKLTSEHLVRFAPATDRICCRRFPSASKRFKQWAAGFRKVVIAHRNGRVDVDDGRPRWH